MDRDDKWIGPSGASPETPGKIMDSDDKWRGRSRVSPETPDKIMDSDDKWRGPETPARGKSNKGKNK